MREVSLIGERTDKNVCDIKKNRNGKIDFLRFLFGFIIVMHHSREFLGDDISLFLGGSLGVEYFFFVSGYLMMVHIEKKNRLGMPECVGKETVQYILKKWCSVLPESLLSWVIGFFYYLYYSPRKNCWNTCAKIYRWHMGPAPYFNDRFRSIEY